jgi:hypothetical protein
MADKYKEYKKILYGKSYTTNEQYKKNQKTINTYKARLEAGGVDESKLDKRNFLEKALNLTPNQNFIFDIFELINRPQQALFGGIENTQQGGDFLEGAKKGITGNKRTQFKDILMNTGEFDDRKGKLDLVDALGFAGDVFLDPMDIPFIPISAASKGATVGAKVADAATDAAKIADTATDVAKAADTASDAIRFISPTQGLGMLAKSGISKGVDLADTGIEKVLKTIDESKGVKYVNPDAKWASELGKMGEGSALLEMYKGMKNGITTMFDTKLSRNARYANKLNEAKQELVGRYLQANADEVKNILEAAAPKVGKTTEEVAKDLNKIVDTVNEIPLRSVIEGAQDGTIKYSKKIENALIDLASDNPDKAEKLIADIAKDKNGMLTLGESWYKKGILGSLDTEKLDKMIKRPSLYSMAERKEIQELTKLYQAKAPEAIKAVQDFYTNANDVVGNAFSAFKGLDDKFDLRNLEGFSKHKASDTYNQNLMKMLDFGADPNAVDSQLLKGQGSMSNTSAGTLNARKYNMPLGEANILKQRELMNIPGLSKEGKEYVKNNVKLFDESALAGIQDYVNNMPRYAKHTQMLDEVLMKQGFGDLGNMSSLKTAIAKGENVAENTEKLNKLLDNSPFRLLENGKAPAGFKKLDKDTKEYLVNFLRSTGNKTGNNELVKMSKDLNRLNNVAVDPTVLNILKINTDTTRKSEFLKLYDKALNYFKGNKTMSLTNQMNNLFGNTSNMFLAGMDGKDYVKYVNQSLSELRDYEKILNKAAQSIDPKTGIPTLANLTDVEKKIYENVNGFQSNVSLLSAEAISKKYDLEGVVKKVAKDNPGLPLDPVRRFFGGLNASEDRIFKYAMYLKATDDPNFIRNLGIELAQNADKATIARAAGEAVGKALVDPDDLTAFEKTTMKRLVPFYTFTKKNLAYQISNMGNNLQRYNKLMKAYNSATANFGDNYENMAEYLKENMYIPIPTIDEKGNYKFIRAQLPFGDLIDFASNPIEGIANKTSPLLKLPIELSTNKNTFTGRDIEKFPGQYGSIEMFRKIPFLGTAKGEQVLNDLTGLDMPFKQIDRVISAFKNDRPQDAFINNVTISGNVDTDKLNKSYDDIDELKNLMKQYEQQGYHFSTIQELKKANKNGTVANLNAIFAKYGIK